ncbi:MAG: hypothetical protein OXJ56_00510 [Rhodospirillaceae bacterium]|nr:hypothetical protein [Rhodospirillaceae bacterium]
MSYPSATGPNVLDEFATIAKYLCMWLRSPDRAPSSTSIWKDVIGPPPPRLCKTCENTSMVTLDAIAHSIDETVNIASSMNNCFRRPNWSPERP